MTTLPMVRRLLSPATLNALKALYKHELANQTTPDDDLNVLAGLMLSSKATRVLQFGTFLGGSAIVLADLASQNGTGAKLLTVDPNPEMNLSCKRFAEMAGLVGMIETIDGYSTDPTVLQRCAQENWDFIYLDTTHQFQQTAAEIKEIAKLCGPATLFAFHDASTYAADNLDQGHQGGVKRAIREYCVLHPRWQSFTFEQPAFGQFGIAVMQRKVA